MAFWDNLKEPMADIPHVVILGAGFGGIGALKKLRDAGVRITLIDNQGTR